MTQVNCILQSAQSHNHVLLAQRVPLPALLLWALPVLPGGTSHLRLSVFLILPKSPHSVPKPNSRYPCLLPLGPKERGLQKVLNHLDVPTAANYTVSRPKAPVPDFCHCHIWSTFGFAPTFWTSLPLATSRHLLPSSNDFTCVSCSKNSSQLITTKGNLIFSVW